MTVSDAALLAADALVADASAGARRRWRTDPVAWTRERLGEELWSKQAEIAQRVVENRRVAVRSCHGVGKSYVASRIAGWWVDTHPVDEVFVVTSAPTASQVRAVLWRELRNAHRGCLPGQLLEAEWKIDGRLVALGRSPADYHPETFQGIHAKFLLVILDEANGIPMSLWTAASSLATSEDSRVLAIGNPDDPTSEFATVSKPGSGWATVQVGYLDTPNFSGEQVSDSLRELLIGPSWVEEQRVRFGVDSPIYCSKVLGEFPEQSEDSLIGIVAVRAAQACTLEPKGTHTLGVDVARYGSDKTVIVERIGPFARVISTTSTEDTMTTAGRVVRALEETGAELAAIDTVGVGGGVFDRLSELGAAVQDMQAGQSAHDSEHFANRRAEWFWGLRKRFEDGDVDIDPEDDELASQLLSLKYHPNSRGQVLIESKEDLKKRGMPSPDRADALAMAFGSWDTSWLDVYAVPDATPTSRRSDVEQEPSEHNPWLDVYGVGTT